MDASRDAYGHALLDALEGRPAFEVVERDDGFVALSPGPPQYLARFERWLGLERAALRRVRGRVLDVGCGGGRVALHLQQRGFDVVGIDISPLAIRVCRRRGVKQVHVLSIQDVGERLGTFDTLVMFGNNLGLLGSPARGRRLLRRFHRLMAPGARIVGASIDPYRAREHRGYHARNRERGRPGGQLRIRVRYRQYTTLWFDYWLLSRSELEALVEPSGWRVARFLDSPGDPRYVAVIERAER